MTEKLYYHDSYTTVFHATVIERLRIDGQLGVVLDRTFFYPTSGGQPCDRGTINGVQVQDVTLRDEDGAIVHLLADEIWDDQVRGEIDWARRFDHMQQHTGQHILSAAFVWVANAETIGFHLGAESCTIDLDLADLSPDQVRQVEEMANQTVSTNRPVHATIVAENQIHGLGLRKPLQVNGPIRTVEIQEFDVAACGGTHVSHTSQVGTIKIVKLENRGKGLRVEFLCGRRALIDHGQKHAILTQLANDLTVGYWEVPEAVERLRAEVKTLRADARKANERLLEYEAAELLRRAEHQGDLHIVTAVLVDRDRQDLNWLAKRLYRPIWQCRPAGAGGPQITHLVRARRGRPTRHAPPPQDRAAYVGQHRRWWSPTVGPGRWTTGRRGARRAGHCACQALVTGPPILADAD